MSMMGELTFFLGLQIKQSSKEIFISQAKYTKDLIKKLGMENAKPIGTPMSPTTTIEGDKNRKSVDEIIYRGMIGSLLYLTASRPDIIFSVCFSDADFASDRTDRKRTSGTCQLLGNALIFWHSKKQNCVALSTTKAKHLAVGSCCTQILWIMHQLLDYDLTLTSTTIFCDNTGDILLEFISIESQLADIFTKSPLEERFCLLRKKIGIISIA
uniref:Uncharacterized mitochondrial protein AtMg00810-like n=1 Tax=Nicotiana tabacum TaxID=4097 RepID=A0A1S4CBD1_TOBAC|nr:PREDICTED: uncharacterized mitochondrial protein AtMg00810-like [Nicotiana tabacum]